MNLLGGSANHLKSFQATRPISSLQGSRLLFIPRCRFSLRPIVLLLPLAYGCSAETAGESFEYAGDTECDDRSFMGTGMASSLDRDDTGKDSQVCYRLLQAGMIQQVSKEKGIAATLCETIDFGDDSSEWANDDEWDDPRFDGHGTSSTFALDDLMIDASDCRSQCRSGTIRLRVPE